MSDATKMCDELLQLVRGTVPSTRVWMTEIPNGMHLPGSRNKPLVCKTADAYYSFLTGKPERVLAALAWWDEFCDLPLSAGEELTPEEVYRGMMVFAAFSAAGLARKVGQGQIERKLLDYTRSHVAWLVLGAGGGPGRKVTDHHLNKPTEPCVLIGDGQPISALPYIAQAGMRGWVRNREDGPQTFLFVNSEGLSAMVGLAAAFQVNENRTKWECDMFSATAAFAPGIEPLGFSADDRVALRDYLRNTASMALAGRVVQWAAANVPSLDFEFVRYADASVVVYMLKNHGSSTDDRMIDSWFAGGKTMKASADDGLRSSHLPMAVFETPSSYVCSGGGRSVSVPKSQVPESYRVSVRSGEVALHTTSAPAPTPEPTPAPQPQPDPTNPATQRESRWRFL